MSPIALGNPLLMAIELAPEIFQVVQQAEEFFGSKADQGSQKKAAVLSGIRTTAQQLPSALPHVENIIKGADPLIDLFVALANSFGWKQAAAVATSIQAAIPGAEKVAERIVGSVSVAAGGGPVPAVDAPQQQQAGG